MDQLRLCLAGIRRRVGLIGACLCAQVAILEGRTSTGPVLLYFERVDWDRETWMVSARGDGRTIRQEIKGILGGEYTITDPFTGEVIVEPGWKLMALIKAATERVWGAEAVPAAQESTGNGQFATTMG